MSDKYFWKWCGQIFSSVRALSTNTCPRHPNKGRHELYEGQRRRSPHPSIADGRHPESTL